MGRVYTATLEDFSITTAADIMELQWPSTRSGILLSVEFGQRTDYGDSLALGFDLSLRRVTTSGTGGGTSVVPRPHSPGDAASGVTIETLNTGAAGGTVILLRRIPFNAQAGYLYQPPVVEQFEIAPSGIIVLALATTLTSALTGSLNVTFMEIG
jgi:hypothetical protein